MVSLPRFGSLWAFGPTAHRADASLRAARALETLARCGLRGWCGRTARAVGAGTRLPRQERARAAGLLTGRGEHSSCGIRRCLPQAAFLAPGCSIIRASLTVALMVSLPSQISAFCALAARSPCICSRLRVALRFAQQPTGLTLPCAPFGRSQRSLLLCCGTGLGALPQTPADAKGSACPVGTCHRRWQSDPQRGSETSGGRGQRPPRH